MLCFIRASLALLPLTVPRKLLLRLTLPFPLLRTSPNCPDCALAAAIFRLAHGASYATMACRFGISLAESCRAFFTVCKAVTNKLGYLFKLHIDSERVVVAGWPSTLKLQSKLFLDVENIELLQGPSYKLSDGSLIPQF
ncbi:hypothetical protein HN51_037352, partial [Arachis hypogaea]